MLQLLVRSVTTIEMKDFENNPDKAKKLRNEVENYKELVEI